MTPIEFTIVIVSLIVALAVPWNRESWQPNGYSVGRWLLCVVLVFMLCAKWLR